MATTAPLPSALLRGPAARPDGLTPPQRRVMVVAIAVAHVAAFWALLQVREVREAVAQAAPMFVSLVAPEKKVEPVPPPPPEPPVPRKPPPPRIIAAAPTPAPSPQPTFTAPPIEEAPPPPQVVAVAPAPAPAPVPAPPPPKVEPRVIPASAVQYLEPLSVEYPRLSKRLNETGRVMVRVFIDEGGLAKNTQVSRSSGHPRLDEAALSAVQKARFKPYTENGQAVSGWAFIPLDFELEK